MEDPRERDDKKGQPAMEPCGTQKSFLETRETNEDCSRAAAQQKSNTSLDIMEKWAISSPLMRDLMNRYGVEEAVKYLAGRLGRNDFFKMTGQVSQRR